MQTPDCSTELVIDSIVLNVDVLHSIRNNLPIPMENLLVQKIRRPKATYPWRTLASVVVVCLGIASMYLLSGAW